MADSNPEGIEVPKVDGEKIGVEGPKPGGRDVQQPLTSTEAFVSVLAGLKPEEGVASAEEATGEPTEVQKKIDEVLFDPALKELEKDQKYEEIPELIQRGGESDETYFGRIKGVLENKFNYKTYVLPRNEENTSFGSELEVRVYEAGEVNIFRLQTKAEADRLREVGQRMENEPEEDFRNRLSDIWNKIKPYATKKEDFDKEQIAADNVVPIIRELDNEKPASEEEGQKAA